MLHMHTHTHTHTHTLEISHKKNEILQFETTWMDLEGIILSIVNYLAVNQFSSVQLLSRV